jgi:hypothetical protein
VAGDERQAWLVYPRENTPTATVWESIRARTGADIGDWILVNQMGEEVSEQTCPRTGDVLDLLQRLDQPGLMPATDQSQDGWAELLMGAESLGERVGDLDRLIRNIRRRPGVGGCTIWRSGVIWDESPIRDGDVLRVRANGPGGSQRSPPAPPGDIDEVLWQPIHMDGWEERHVEASDSADSGTSW